MQCKLEASKWLAGENRFRSKPFSRLDFSQLAGTRKKKKVTLYKKFTQHIIYYIFTGIDEPSETSMNQLHFFVILLNSQCGYFFRHAPNKPWNTHWTDGMEPLSYNVKISRLDQGFITETQHQPSNVRIIHYLFDARIQLSNFFVFFKTFFSSKLDWAVIIRLNANK